MINVLMIGSDLSVKGGMTTVVKSFLNNNFEDVNITYVPTHIENVGKMYKILFFIKSLIIIVKNLIMNDVNIVHIHLSERGSFFRKLIVVLICKVFGKKVINHLHGADFKEFYNNNKYIQSTIKFMFLKCDCVIVLGEKWNIFVKSIDERIKTFILRNSVELMDYCVEYNDKNVNILFLAVLIKRKGIFDLIKAVDKIRYDKELTEYNIKFVLAGSGNDEVVIKRQIKNLDLEKYFIFKGWIDGKEKIETIKTSQIFILPSYNEGLPMSILEAMSFGMPIITTNVGSIDEAVQNNVNGYIVNPGNVEEIYESIKKIIVNHDLWKKFSKQSKYTIKEKFNKDQYFIKMKELYYSI